MTPLNTPSPTATLTAGASASAALAAEVRKKVRETGLVLWLDAGAQYGDLVDALAGGSFAFSYPVVSLRAEHARHARPRKRAAREHGGGGARPDARPDDEVPLSSGALRELGTSSRPWRQLHQGPRE